MKQKSTKTSRRRLGAKLLLVVLLTVLAIPATTATAAQVTNYKAIFRRLKASTNSEGIIMYFKTPTGIQTGGGDNITLTFSSDFVLAAEAALNFDIALDSDSNCDNDGFTEETVVLNTATATEWAVDVTGQVITFFPETDDVLTAGNCIRIRMGQDAITGGTGAANTVQNGAVDDDDTIALAGGIGDTGTLAVDIITDDQVSVTATVDATISFSISDNTVGFGSLKLATGRWATGDTLGTDASATTPTAAHTMSIATNAASGYAVTYNGATLTSGSNTINVASVDEDSDGTPGTEQFGLSVSTSGNATIATGYLRDAVADFTLVASTTTTIVSETVPTDTETLSVSYLGNIAGTTEAGSYSTTITYIATGTF